MDLPPEFIELSASACAALSAHYDRMAIVLRQRQAQLDEIAAREARTAAAVDYYRQSPRAVLDKLAAGWNSLESAIEAVARDMQLPAFAVAAQYRAFIKARGKAERAQRMDLVVRLVQAGLTNAEIAQRLKIHPNTVSRDISAHLHGDLRPVDRARLRKRRQQKRPGF